MISRGARVATGVILIVIGVIALLYYGTNNASGGATSVEYDHKVHLGQEMREIRIETDNLSLDVNFVASTTGGNSVHIQGKAPEEIVEQIRSAAVENGVLHLRFVEKKPWFKRGFIQFGRWNEKQRITVSLTDEAMASLQVFKASSDSGSLSVNGAAVQESVITADSGSIRLGSLQGGTLTVKTDSGSIRLEQYEGKSLSLRSDSGSIHAGIVHAGLTAHSDSGSITINELAGAGNIRTDSGAIRIVKGDDTGAVVTSDSGSVRMTVPASYSGSYDVKSVTGSVRFPDPVGTSGEVIKVRTGSGSIQIHQ